MQANTSLGAIMSRRPFRGLSSVEQGRRNILYQSSLGIYVCNDK